MGRIWSCFAAKGIFIYSTGTKSRRWDTWTRCVTVPVPPEALGNDETRLAGELRRFDRINNDFGYVRDGRAAGPCAETRPSLVDDSETDNTISHSTFIRSRLEDTSRGLLVLPVVPVFHYTSVFLRRPRRTSTSKKTTDDDWTTSYRGLPAS